MRKYRIVTVHRVTQTIERIHEFEAAGLAEVGARLDRANLMYANLHVRNPAWTLVEATIIDVTPPTIECVGDQEEG